MIGARGISVPLLSINIYEGSTAPSTGRIGDMWMDTSVSPPVVKVCTSTSPLIWATYSLSGGNASIQFQDEGGNLGTSGTVETVNFTGAGVAASRVGNTVTVNVPGDTRAIGITIDGGGSAITTGVKGYINIPFNCTITAWTLFADQSGSIVIDVWKDTYANFPPTVADSIAGTEKPTLTAAQKNEDSSLTTWTTSVSAGDVLSFNVDSATTVTRVTLVLTATTT